MKDSRLKSKTDAKYFSTDHLKSGLRKRAVGGAGVTIFSRATVFCINMVSIITLARLLTPNDFGLVAMVTALCMFLMDVGVLGLTEIIIQKEDLEQKQISTLFWINVTLSLILTLLLIALAPLVAWIYNEPQLKAITIATAFAFIITGSSVQHLALLKRNMQFHRFAIIEITAAVISVALAVLMAWQGWGYWSLIARSLAMFLSITVGAWIFCQWRPGLPALKTGIRPMLWSGVNNLGSNFMYYFTKNLDKILIGWRYGTVPLGYYSRAYHLFVLPLNQLSFPLGAVSIATLSRLKNEPERYRRYYLKMLTMLAFVGMLLSALLTLTGSDLILLLLGPQWNRAGQIFTIFGPGIGIMLIYGTYGSLHLSLGRADRQFRWGITAFVVTALSFLIGLQFGSTGVAVAYTASFYILIGPCLWYAGKPIHLKLSSVFSVIWKYYISAFVAGLLSWLVLYSFNPTSNIFVELNTFLKILVSSAICTLLYLIAVVTLHQSLEPISQFISILNDMAPNFLSKKEG